jgi:hypothetical protein
MTCPRTAEHLSKTEGKPLAKISPEFAEHSRHCPDCRNALTGLRRLQSEIAAISPSPRELAASWERLEKRLPSSSSAVPPHATGIWAWSWFQPALALGLVFLLFLGLTSYNPKSVAPATQLCEDLVEISGTFFSLLPETAANTTLPLFITHQTEVFLEQSISRAHLTFSDCGTITFLGEGRFRLIPQGFAADQGSFSADFQKTRSNFRVQVFDTIFQITGTSLSFALQNGSGSVRLLSGTVAVTSPGFPDFFLKPGQELVFSGGRLAKPTAPKPLQKSPQPRAGTASASATPRTLPASPAHSAPSPDISATPALVPGAPASQPEPTTSPEPPAPFESHYSAPDLATNSVSDGFGDDSVPHP